MFLIIAMWAAVIIGSMVIKKVAPKYIAWYQLYGLAMGIIETVMILG